MNARYHDMQLRLHQDLMDELKNLADNNARVDRELNTRKLEGRELVQNARAIKWQTRRIARMALAIEVLESIDPHTR